LKPRNQFYLGTEAVMPKRKKRTKRTTRGKTTTGGMEKSHVGFSDAESVASDISGLTWELDSTFGVNTAMFGDEEMGGVEEGEGEQAEGEWGEWSEPASATGSSYAMARMEP
jgi:hypothetical protein